MPILSWYLPPCWRRRNHRTQHQLLALWKLVLLTVRCKVLAPWPCGVAFRAVNMGQYLLGAWLAGSAVATTLRARTRAWQYRRLHCLPRRAWPSCMAGQAVMPLKCLHEKFVCL